MSERKRTPVVLYDAETEESSEDLEPVKPTKSTQSEIEERRGKVLQLRLRGMSLTKISEELKISVGTVKRDLDQARDDVKTALVHFDKELFISEITHSMDDVVQRAWDEYNAAPPSTALRLKALDLVRIAHNDRYKFMQECGLIQKKEDPRKIEVTHEVIHNWSPEIKEIAARAFLQGILTTELLPPTPEKEIIDVQPVENSDEYPTDTDGKPEGSEGSNAEIEASTSDS